MLPLQVTCDFHHFFCFQTCRKISSFRLSRLLFFFSQRKTEKLWKSSCSFYEMWLLLLRKTRWPQPTLLSVLHLLCFTSTPWEGIVPPPPLGISILMLALLLSIVFFAGTMSSVAGLGSVSAFKGEIVYVFWGLSQIRLFRPSRSWPRCTQRSSSSLSSVKNNGEAPAVTLLTRLHAS